LRRLRRRLRMLLVVGRLPPLLEHFPDKACPGLDPGMEFRFSAENATTRRF
jgi:hypothetical protein